MIVGILGPGGCGGTFLDWSIQFLFGSKENLLVNCDTQNRGIVGYSQVQCITDAPLIGSTAHTHQKTHPNNNSLPVVMDIFSASEYPLNTFYYVDDMLPDQTHTNYNNIIKTYPTVKFVSYNFSYKHIESIFCLQYEKIDGAKRRFDTQVGKTLSNLSTGELREILSLFYPKCIKGQILNEQLDKADNLYIINYDDIWTNLDTIIFDIFKFLELAIDNSRYTQWVQVYHTWLEKNKTDFFEDLPKIIDCIVTGKLLDLGKYNITFAREVVIASKLLYNHNLSLKFDGVNDLTKNTIQWHSILEKNTYHNLEIGRV